MRTLTRHFTAVLLLAVGLASPVTAYAQDTEGEADRCSFLAGDESDTGASAVGSASMELADGTIDVCFRSPRARGRPVFGHSVSFADTQWVVQYDALWNTGVVLETSAPVDVAGVSLQPGSYGVWAIPSSFEWIVVLNSNVDGLAAGADYAAIQATEVGRGIVRSSSTAGYLEALSVEGRASGAASGDLVLAWERTRLPIPVRAGTDMVPACPFRGDPATVAGRTSPGDSLVFSVAGSPAKVCYGRPSARDRVVFGNLVPWDDMWRLGANETTTIHLPVAAEIAGIPVEAGSYSIYVIPSRGDWVIVVNSSTNQWGRITPTPRFGSSYTPEVRAAEVGRALVSSELTEAHVETLTITAAEGHGGADLVIEWERTRVRIPVVRR